MRLRRQITCTAVEFPTFMSPRHGSWNRNYARKGQRSCSSLTPRNIWADTKAIWRIRSSEIRRWIRKRKRKTCSKPLTLKICIAQVKYTIGHFTFPFSQSFSMSRNQTLRLAGDEELCARNGNARRNIPGCHFQFIHRSRDIVLHAIGILQMLHRISVFSAHSSRIHCSIDHQSRANSALVTHVTYCIYTRQIHIDIYSRNKIRYGIFHFCVHFDKHTRHLHSCGVGENVQGVWEILRAYFRGVKIKKRFL